MIVKRNYEMLKDMSLPKWLEDQLPEPLPQMIISFNNGRFHVNGKNFESIMSAYDYAARFKRDFQIIFHKSVDGHSGKLDGAQFYADGTHFETQKPHKFLLPALNTDDHLFGLKYSYFVWLTQYSMTYSEDPKLFYNAYNFLTHHPVFWIKENEEKSYQWITNKGLQLAKTNVSLQKDGTTMISLTHGGHRPYEYTRHYLDTDLSSHAETYEKVVIAFAQKVHNRFDLDGYER